VTAYRLAEIASLSVGDEFIDRNDFPHHVTGFTFWPDNIGVVTVLTDLLPLGVVYDTTALVYVPVTA
jgi:hypothetical protein